MIWHSKSNNVSKVQLAQKNMQHQRKKKNDISNVLWTSIAKKTYYISIWQQMKSAEQYDDFWLHFYFDLFFVQISFLFLMCFFCSFKVNLIKWIILIIGENLFIIWFWSICWPYHSNWSNSLQTLCSHYDEKTCSSTIFHHNSAWQAHGP